MSDIKITIGGDATQLDAALKKSQAEISKTAIEAVKLDSKLAAFSKTGNVFAATVPPAFGKTAEAIKQTQKPVEILNKGIGSIGKESVEAKESVVNLASSLKKLGGPIGEIGEHAQELAEGFAEAGIAGLAIAGISIGVHLLSEAFKKSGESAGEAKKEISEYGKLVQESISKVSDNVGQVEVLVSAYDKENISQREKVNIIKELQKISPEYFGQLDTEKTTIDQLTAAYDKFTNSIYRQINAEIKRGQLKAIIEKRLQLDVDLNLNEPDTKFEPLFQQANKAVGKLKDIFKKEPFKFKTEDDQSFGLTQQLYERGLKTRNKLLKEEADLVKQIALGTDFSLKGDKENKIRTIADVLKELRAELDALNTKEVELKTDEAKAKVSALDGAIKELITKFGKPGKDNTIKLFAEIKQIEFIEHLKENLATQIKGEPIKISPIVEIDPVIKFGDFEKRLEAFNDLRKATAKRLESFRDLFANFGQDILTSFAEGIGKLATGGGLSGFFDSMFKTVGDGLKKLGVFFLAGSKLIAKIKTLIASAPALSAVAALGLIALGTAISAAASNKQGFASGTTGVERGGFFPVGERGAENIFLPSGTKVQPNNELKAYGGGQQIVVLEHRIEGAAIVIAGDRARAQMERNGGVATY